MTSQSVYSSSRPTSSLPDTRARKAIEDMLAGSGVRLNGDAPWDIQVHDARLFWRVLRHGSIGLGEAYMDGWWDCKRIDDMIRRVLEHGLGHRAHTVPERFLYKLQHTLTNLQSKTRAFIVGEAHYDFGNDLFERMLDPTMSYSCGYWKDAITLEQAQRAKLDLAARKLELEPGMKVLDIGCGWGSFAEHAARHYGVKVTGITISKEQAELARKHCRDLPVEILLKDYRELEGRFDRIVSIGMFEHVGQKNYQDYFDAATHLLSDQGLFVLHTIGSNDSHIAADPWINKYILPNGILPSAAQLVTTSENRLVMEDWQNFGPDYDRTLMAWHANLDAAWESLSDTYDERIRRMFTYYLCCCAGAFRARDIQLWQVVFSRCRKGRYDAPR
ncbi:cyclopropane fatty acyl phospholipid synthase [Larsenimonas salina]|uniref:cyclopropane fatty acyl phospholipid synthase n=1 Tax=Larsenimonas salina TaxID=1295565 RepID=UPI002073BDFC|nr:cyclopropane fatty acyl phospholipid synthase [Larsenimonas salina]MCM5703531.1 cyclopropane fatty acyl phospholipid synthase [Larsenimonas salina]